MRASDEDGPLQQSRLYINIPPSLRSPPSSSWNQILNVLLKVDIAAARAQDAAYIRSIVNGLPLVLVHFEHDMMRFCLV